MKISVITITCRQNPRLAEMARTLAATQQRVVKDEVELVWIVVDELDPNRVYQTMEAEFAGRNLRGFGVAGIPTPPTEHRSGPDRAVAHNTARNAGLALALANASADYIVMLNDCNIVSMDWASVVRDCAAKGVGWKCKTDVIADMPVPADGIVKHKGHHDLLRPVPVMTVAGACWGAPAKYFYAINGFDTAYDGQRKGNDVDAIVRMSRMGLQFVTTARAYTLQLRRTKIDDEVTTRKDVYAGARNSALLNQLIRDKQRRLPTIANHFTLGVAQVALPPPPDAGVVQPPVPGDPRGGQHAAPVTRVLPASTPGGSPTIVSTERGAPPLIRPEQLVKDETYKTITANHPSDLNELIEGRAKLVDQPDGTAAVLLEGEATDDYLDDLPGPGLD